MATSQAENTSQDSENKSSPEESVHKSCPHLLKSVSRTVFILYISFGMQWIFSKRYTPNSIKVVGLIAVRRIVSLNSHICDRCQVAFGLNIRFSFVF